MGNPYANTSSRLFSSTPSTREASHYADAVRRAMMIPPVSQESKKKKEEEEEENEENIQNFDAIAAVRRFNAKLSAANAVFEQQTSCLRTLLSDSRKEIRKVSPVPAQSLSSHNPSSSLKELVVKKKDEEKARPRPPRSIEEALALLVP